MSLPNIPLTLCFGFCAGILSGLFGIGGGLIIVPALIYFFGFTQHQAQGTSLMALVLPTGAAALFKYYKAGNVDITTGVLIAIGLFLGGFLGATIAQSFSPVGLRKVFGVFMATVGIYLAIKK